MCLQTSCNQATRTFNWPRCILFLVPPRPPQLGFSRNACMHQFEMVKCDQPCIMYNTTQYQILYEYLPSSPSVSVCVCFHVFFFQNVNLCKKETAKSKRFCFGSDSPNVYSQARLLSMVSSMKASNFLRRH